MTEENKAPEVNKTSSGMEQNVAGLLCYLVGWITGIIFLIIEKDNKFVRFHAFQSIFAFGALFILAFIPFVNWAVGILGFIIWIVCMIQAYQGKLFKLPIVGDLAEKQVK